MINKKLKAMKKELIGFDAGQKLLKIEVALGEFFLKRAESTRKKQVEKVARSMKAAGISDENIRTTVKVLMEMDI